MKWGCLGVVGAVLLLVVHFVYTVYERTHAKTVAMHAEVARSEFADFLQEVDPEVQFESDTCGLHTLRVIYKAYGLEPDEENLRVRLGVDVPSNPMDGTTTGTVQPDLLRVVAQDGFTYTPLFWGSPSPEKELTDHLASGHMAAVLIARRENGNMHWVAAYRLVDGRIEILDSLFKTPYFEPPEAFIQECVLSCILLKPSEEAIPQNVTMKALMVGSDEMRHTIERYRLLQTVGRH